MDTRPGTKFTDDGLCPACKYYDTLEDVDWKERQSILKNIAKFGKENSKGEYDCIIGVSGGKDSVRQALFVKNILKMNPLLVCLSYPPDQVTQMGVDNLSNLIELGFDCVTIYPDPVVWKKLLRKGFLDYGNYLKSCELALFASVPRFAIAYQIPLIWWGENSALQVGEAAVMGKTGYDGNNLRNMNTLGGGDISWLLDDEIKESNVFQHTYPSQEEIDRANIKITFLGYFWRDWSSINNGIFSAMQGIQFRENKPWETGDLYGITALDEDWVVFNQAIKYLKFGFGRISDYVNEEIRHQRISRDEGIALVEKYDGSFHNDYVLTFCNYIGITQDEFWNHVDTFVNYSLFRKDGRGKYVRKFKVGVGI